MLKIEEFDDSRAKTYRQKSYKFAFPCQCPVTFHQSWGDQKMKPPFFVMISLGENNLPTGVIYGCMADSDNPEVPEGHEKMGFNSYRKSVLVRAYRPGEPFRFTTVTDGRVEVEEGRGDADDWLIRNPKGELYTNSPKEFEAYEEVLQ